VQAKPDVVIGLFPAASEEIDMVKDDAYDEFVLENVSCAANTGEKVVPAVKVPGGGVLYTTFETAAAATTI